MKNVWKKRIAFLLAIVMIVSMMVVVNAAKGDYAEWKENYDSTGVDPYESYYSEWEVPSVAEVYEKYGEAVADYYVQGWKEAMQTMGPIGIEYSRECMQITAADLEKDAPEIIAKASPIPEESDAPANTDNPIETPPVQNVQYFADVPEDAWYAEAVNAMAQTGLIGGRPDGLFYPEDTITLGEWATIIWRIVGGWADRQGYMNPKWPAGSEAETLYPHWASRALYWTGTGNEGLRYINATYSEDGSAEETPCSRYQAVLSIVKIVDAERFDYPQLLHHYPERDDGVPDALEARQTEKDAKVWGIYEIPDYESISDKKYEALKYSGQEAVVRAYNLGIINGMDDAGTFDPNRTLTRAQACQMLYNAMLTRSRPVEGYAKGGAF